MPLPYVFSFLWTNERVFFARDREKILMWELISEMGWCAHSLMSQTHFLMKISKLLFRPITKTTKLNERYDIQTTTYRKYKREEVRRICNAPFTMRANSLPFPICLRQSIPPVLLHTAEITWNVIRQCGSSVNYFHPLYKKMVGQLDDTNRALI